MKLIKMAKRKSSSRPTVMLAGKEDFNSNEVVRVEVYKDPYFQRGRWGNCPGAKIYKLKKHRVSSKDFDGSWYKLTYLVLFDYKHVGILVNSYTMQSWKGKLERGTFRLYDSGNFKFR